jgi:hypothetical protein
MLARRDSSGREMDQKSKLDDVTATEVHNRLAKQIVSRIVNEPIAASGNISDVMLLCESVLVGAVLGCFQLGGDVKAFDLIVGHVKDRLAKIRLEDLEMQRMTTMISRPGLDTLLLAIYR